MKVSNRVILQLFVAGIVAINGCNRTQSGPKPSTENVIEIVPDRNSTTEPVITYGEPSLVSPASVVFQVESPDQLAGHVGQSVQINGTLKGTEGRIYVATETFSIDLRSDYPCQVKLGSVVSVVGTLCDEKTAPSTSISVTLPGIVIQSSSPPSSSEVKYFLKDYKIVK